MCRVPAFGSRPVGHEVSLGSGGRVGCPYPGNGPKPSIPASPADQLVRADQGGQACEEAVMTARNQDRGIPRTSSTRATIGSLVHLGVARCLSRAFFPF
jgi:hypothetical protein